jgi:hypothetical protein
MDESHNQDQSQSQSPSQPPEPKPRPRSRRGCIIILVVLILVLSLLLWDVYRFCGCGVDDIFSQINSAPTNPLPHPPPARPGAAR